MLGVKSARSVHQWVIRDVSARSLDINKRGRGVSGQVQRQALTIIVVKSPKFGFDLIITDRVDATTWQLDDTLRCAYIRKMKAEATKRQVGR
jgi:hypothetical protein